MESSRFPFSTAVTHTWTALQTFNTGVTLGSGSQLACDDTTDSTSGTTGSIQTDGGLGVVKSIYALGTLTINRSGATPSTAWTRGNAAALLIIGEAATATGFYVDSYGQNNGGQSGFACGGTATSPTATTNGLILSQVRAWGWDGTGTSHQSGGRITWSATEAWGSGAHGSMPSLNGILTGATAETTVLSFAAATGFLSCRGISASDTTDSTSTTTGSVVFSGGVGFGAAKSMFGGGYKAVSDTIGIGYATGAGSTVTQITSRTTGVTINKVCGEITLFSTAGSATPASFTVTNSAMAATDSVILNQKSGTDLYHLLVTAKGSGSFQITAFTTGGTTSEAPVISFAIIKGVAA